MMWPFKKKEEKPRPTTMGSFKVKDCTATLWYKNDQSDVGCCPLTYKGWCIVTKSQAWGCTSGADVLQSAIENLKKHGIARIGSVAIKYENFLMIDGIVETERIELHEIYDDPGLWPEEVLHPCNT